MKSLAEIPISELKIGDKILYKITDFEHIANNVPDNSLLTIVGIRNISKTSRMEYVCFERNVDNDLIQQTAPQFKMWLKNYFLLSDDEVNMLNVIK